MRDGKPVERLVQDGTRPGRQLLDELEPRLVENTASAPKRTAMARCASKRATTPISTPG